MLVSLIGLVTIVLVALVIGALKIEKHLWSSDWRLMFPGYRKAAVMKDIADRLQVHFDGQDDMLSQMESDRDSLWNEIHEPEGLNAQVADLKKVLGWTRTRCGELQTLNETTKRDIEGYQNKLHVSEVVRRDQDKALRKRATEIRQLKGLPARKRK